MLTAWMTEQELDAYAAAWGEPTDDDAEELGLATMAEVDVIMAGVRADHDSEGLVIRN